MDICFCNGCVYRPMCGKKKEIMIEQAKASQAVKRVYGVENFTGCRERKLEEGAKGVIRILIDGVDVEREENDAVEKAES